MVETAYLLYLAITLTITIWVARTLSKNGVVFLIQCFGQNETLARSTNHLLVVGFYLVNIGFITLTLSLGNEPTTLTGAPASVALVPPRPGPPASVPQTRIRPRSRYISHSSSLTQERSSCRARCSARRSRPGSKSGAGTRARRAL